MWIKVTMASHKIKKSRDKVSSNLTEAVCRQSPRTSLSDQCCVEKDSHIPDNPFSRDIHDKGANLTNGGRLQRHRWNEQSLQKLLRLKQNYLEQKREPVSSPQKQSRTISADDVTTRSNTSDKQNKGTLHYNDRKIQTFRPTSSSLDQIRNVPLSDTEICQRHNECKEHISSSSEKEHQEVLPWLHISSELDYSQTLKENDDLRNSGLVPPYQPLECITSNQVHKEQTSLQICKCFDLKKTEENHKTLEAVSGSITATNDPVSKCSVNVNNYQLFYDEDCDKFNRFTNSLMRSQVLSQYQDNQALPELGNLCQPELGRDLGILNGMQNPPIKYSVSFDHKKSSDKIAGHGYFTAGDNLSKSQSLQDVSKYSASTKQRDYLKEYRAKYGMLDNDDNDDDTMMSSSVPRTSSSGDIHYEGDTVPKSTTHNVNDLDDVFDNRSLNHLPLLAKYLSPDSLTSVYKNNRVDNNELDNIDYPAIDPDLSTYAPRTAALLNNPEIRKYLTVQKVDAKNPSRRINFKDHLQDKRRKSSLGSASVPIKAFVDTLQENKSSSSLNKTLSVSQSNNPSSEISYLKITDLSENRKEGTTNTLANENVKKGVSALGASHEQFDSATKVRQKTPPLSRAQSDLSERKLSAIQSRFRIPSYSEFKKMRSRSMSLTEEDEEDEAMLNEKQRREWISQKRTKNLSVDSAQQLYKSDRQSGDVRRRSSDLGHVTVSSSDTTCTQPKPGVEVTYTTKSCDMTRKTKYLSKSLNLKSDFEGDSSSLYSDYYVSGDFDTVSFDQDSGTEASPRNRVNVSGFRNIKSRNSEQLRKLSTEYVHEQIGKQAQRYSEIYAAALKDSLHPPSSDDLYDKYNILSQKQQEAKQVGVLRSASDISDMTAETSRKRLIKEARQRPYSSDPFDKGSRKNSTRGASAATLNEDQLSSSVSIDNSVQSTREEILTFLDSVLKSGTSQSEGSASVSSLTDFNTSSEPQHRKARNRLSNVSTTSADSGMIGQDGSHDISPDVTASFESIKDKNIQSIKDEFKGSEVERVDSGVGAEIRSSTSKEGHIEKDGPSCEDCKKCLNEEDDDVSNIPPGGALLCARCSSRRSERKETIQEIVDSEVSYGKDMKVIKEEFYAPMEKAGLLSVDQLHSIFCNLDELRHISDDFADKLQDILDEANDQGDEDYVCVDVGKLFLEFSSMFLAYENYCTNQTLAMSLLEQCEREKDLLRVFLQVAQTENSRLRRMNLRSFLMLPIQRIMKYPLLLDRLYKSTPIHHGDKEAVRLAKQKIEDILDHINYKTKGSTQMKLKRRGTLSRKPAACDNLELHKVAIETLGWNRNEANIVLTGRLQYSLITDHMWNKKVKSLRFSYVYGIILTLGKAPSYDMEQDGMFFARKTNVKEAVLVFVKEKGGKYSAAREPFPLDRCIVAVDPECEDVFTLQEMTKDIYAVKADNNGDMEMWVKHLRYQIKDLGIWRKRRQALANIMMQTIAADKS